MVAGIPHFLGKILVMLGYTLVHELFRARGPTPPSSFGRVDTAITFERVGYIYCIYLPTPASLRSSHLIQDIRHWERKICWKGSSGFPMPGVADI